MLTCAYCHAPFDAAAPLYTTLQRGAHGYHQPCWEVATRLRNAIPRAARVDALLVERGRAD